MKTCVKRVNRLLGACVMVGAIVAGATESLVHAEIPPQQKEQVPGYFRMQLGQFEVTALYDGFVDIDATLLGGVSEKTIQSSLVQSYLTYAKPIQTAVNAYLVHTKEHVILVDTGTAKLFGANLGFVIENLRAAGYEPSQIDTILLTHLHPDHAGGLLAQNGEMAFPNAQVFVSRADADYWLSEIEATRAPKDQQALFKMSRDAVAPYIASGKLTIFQAGQKIRDGVAAISAPGHTPGHTAYLFSSRDQHLLVWGDIVHNVAVQFPHPEVAIEFDWDKKTAVASRRALLALSGVQKYWVAGAHIPFPGIGRISVDKKQGYRWVPAEYRLFPDVR